ncbi:NUDIX hydrolase [Lutimonas sp.]|uniref:NUDIX hydrolase n=1 Tax=Lutimonas sp. TaxID=1872403 RepID=UPI003D9BA6CF
MEFDYFLSVISKIENEQLGGFTSHAKMIPKERKIFKEIELQAANPRKAAVLALFYPDEQNLTKFLLILRASYDGTHSSQISFPGGKFERDDGRLEITALRETSEEVGIHENEVFIKRQMTDTYIPPSNFLVSPFIGYAMNKPVFETNHEVEDVLEVKLTDLLSEKSVGSKKLSTSYMENIDVPCFHLNKKVVWGATAMMLSEIKDLIKANLH